MHDRFETNVCPNFTLERFINALNMSMCSTISNQSFLAELRGYVGEDPSTLDVGEDPPTLDVGEDPPTLDIREDPQILDVGEDPPALDVRLIKQLRKFNTPS